MNRLLNWLSKEAAGINLCLLVFACIIFDILYTFGAIKILYSLGGINLLPTATIGISKRLVLLSYSIYFFIIAAFREEMVYRLSLMFAIEKFGRSGAVLWVALVISIIFGWGHGGIIHVFTQGVIGLSFSILFLKCGGFQRHYFKAVMVVTITHAFFNISWLTFLASLKLL